MLQIRNLFSIYFGLYSRGRRLSPAQEPDVARFPNGFLRVGSEKVQCQCHSQVKGLQQTHLFSNAESLTLLTLLPAG